ncbi:alpha/beta hydrolase [Hazenella coriacea]|uniref:Pimeloyl-ACP methyl ester carboxylesterase n=1 Tax=Hazenella coriacea TaxID=1179467 RepID=A0A4R3L6P9_9BACL|nr:alpha/beta fold hydrolase [Hazenella coriacea]TCS93884.1 pimeloyl-ACP methyl ester carboxylesterase [Hazenella coriacea]
MKRFTAKSLTWICLTILSITLVGCQTTDTASKQPETKASSPEQKVTLNEVNIDGKDPNVKLYLRNKFPTDKKEFNSNEIVLFLEPFSVPSAKAFDVPQFSWMEDYAQKGYDTWALDFQGFGQSTKPKELDQPPAENKPVITHKEALGDLEAAVEYIKSQRKVDKIQIVGWSWGAVVGAEYATKHPESVNKLVLYGFMHGFDLPSMASASESKEQKGQLNPKMPAYQIIDYDKGMHHWHMMMNGKDLALPGAWEEVRKVFNESDPTSQQREKQAIRRPLGPLTDLYYIWSSRPLYELSSITSPVLVIRGADDFFAEPHLDKKLTGTKQMKEVVIPEATHWVLYEKNRDRLLNEVDSFLKQP